MSPAQRKRNENDRSVNNCYTEEPNKISFQFRDQSLKNFGNSDSGQGSSSNERTKKRNEIYENIVES